MLFLSQLGGHYSYDMCADVGGYGFNAHYNRCPAGVVFVYKTQLIAHGRLRGNMAKLFALIYIECGLELLGKIPQDV